MFHVFFQSAKNIFETISGAAEKYFNRKHIFFVQNQSVCPPGQVPCYSQNQGITQCGVRAVAGISTADGPSSYGAFPWQAYIENQTQFTGSGVLLDQYHVLTAAHKVNFNT